MILARMRLALAASFALFAGCTTTDHDAVRCGDIPTNGCPVGGTDVCADPTCAAGYACDADGTWTLDHTCPNFVPPHDAGDDGRADAAPDANFSACIDANLPPGAAPSGGPQCIDLIAPDCPLSEVLACTKNGGNPCEVTGCASLYVCESTGWVVWGECEDDGGLVLNGN
jgi:hypothetical protein